MKISVVFRLGRENLYEIAEIHDKFLCAGAKVVKNKKFRKSFVKIKIQGAKSHISHCSGANSQSLFYYCLENDAKLYFLMWVLNSENLI